MMLYMMCCGILSDMNRNYKTASVHILTHAASLSPFVIIQRVLETRANSVKQSACETAVVHTLKKETLARKCHLCPDEQETSHQ